MRLLPALFSLLLLAGYPAAAQDLPKASATVAGGLVLPVGAAGDAMGAGWNVGVAGTVRLSGSVGLRGDYLYSRFGLGTATWDVRLGPMLPAFVQVPVSGKSQMHTASVDLTWGRSVSPSARAYVMAGPSLFHRRVQITSAQMPPGQTAACEPQWFQCPSAAVAFDQALGIRSSNDLGFNLGAGIAFRAGLTALLTIEARYLQVRGPAFTAADGHVARGTAHFVPISLGLSF